MKVKVFSDGFEGYKRRSLERAKRLTKGERVEAERVITFADEADMIACQSHLQQSFDFTSKLPASAQGTITDAMQRVDEHANVNWKAVIDTCIIAAAQKKAEITSDDVLAEWEAILDRPMTHTLAAIGPAMKRAAQDGVLSRTNRVKRSERAVKHGIRHTVWSSNIYREGL